MHIDTAVYMQTQMSSRRWTTAERTDSAAVSQGSTEDTGHPPCSPIMNTADWMKSSSALHSTSHRLVKPAPSPQQAVPSSSRTMVSLMEAEETPSWLLAMGISCIKQERRRGGGAFVAYPVKTADEYLCFVLNYWMYFLYGRANILHCAGL